MPIPQEGGIKCRFRSGGGGGVCAFSCRRVITAQTIANLTFLRQNIHPNLPTACISHHTDNQIS